MGERNFKRKTDVRWIVGGGDARAISVFRNLGGRLTQAWRRGGGAWEIQRASPRRGCGHSNPTLAAPADEKRIWTVFENTTISLPMCVYQIPRANILYLVKVSAMFAIRLGVRFGRAHGRNAARARLFPWRSRVDTAPKHGDGRARPRSWLAVALSRRPTVWRTTVYITNLNLRQALCEFPRRPSSVIL